MSDGSRSGVNCIRRHEPPVERAIALASDVLPTPGTSSMRRWPSENRHTSARCTARRLPRSTRSICAASVSNRSLNDCSGRGAACTVVDLRRGRPGPRRAAVLPGDAGHRRHATVPGVGPTRGDPGMTHGAAFWFPYLLRSLLAVLRRPRLWSTAVRQVVRAIPARWWRGRRSSRCPIARTCGSGSRPRTDGRRRPESTDVVRYLEWCRDRGRSRSVLGTVDRRAGPARPDLTAPGTVRTGTLSPHGR